MAESKTGGAKRIWLPEGSAERCPGIDGGIKMAINRTKENPFVYYRLDSAGELKHDTPYTVRELDWHKDIPSNGKIKAVCMKNCFILHGESVKQEWIEICLA